MKIIYIIFIAWFLSSCTPQPLEVDIPEAEQKPVVASQFYYDTATAQSVLLVILSKSTKPSQSRGISFSAEDVLFDMEKVISGAEVTVLTSYGKIFLLEMAPGAYYGENINLNDLEYCTLSAKDGQGKEIIKASTLAMPEKKFESICITKNASSKYISYTLRDDEKKPNWYLVNYLTKQGQDTGMKYNDPRYIARKLTEQKLDFDLFTDADFKSGNLEIKRKLENIKFDTIAVAVSEISEGYYKFMQVQKKYGLLINQLKGEPITFPSNIQGGLGYFTLHRPYVAVLTDAKAKLTER